MSLLFVPSTVINPVLELNEIERRQRRSNSSKNMVASPIGCVQQKEGARHSPQGIFPVKHSSKHPDPTDRRPWDLLQPAQYGTWWPNIAQKHRVIQSKSRKLVSFLIPAPKCPNLSVVMLQ